MSESRSEDRGTSSFDSRLALCVLVILAAVGLRAANELMERVHRHDQGAVPAHTLAALVGCEAQRVREHLATPGTEPITRARLRIIGQECEQERTSRVEQGQMAIGRAAQAAGMQR